MNVSLTPELENFVQGKVSTGRYTSASEVVREALRLLEEHEKVRASQLGEFRAEADRRLASLDRGEGVDGETVFARIRESPISAAASEHETLRSRTRCSRGS